MSERGEVITLRDEEGHTHDFTLVDVIEIEPHRYAILQPTKEEAAVVFRIEDDTLVVIDDEAEFDRVVEAIQASEEYGDVTLLDGDPHGDPEGDHQGT